MQFCDVYETLYLGFITDVFWVFYLDVQKTSFRGLNINTFTFLETFMFYFLIVFYYTRFIWYVPPYHSSQGDIFNDAEGPV